MRITNPEIDPLKTMQALAQKYPNLSESNQRFAMSYPSFAAGTLVHTEQGLLPIEEVRCGMRVLTQPESGGEREYRPVTNTVATLDQEVYTVQVRVAEDTALYTLIATPNHPFWVESPLVDGEHWLATECLAPGLVLQLADGRRAEVHASGKIRQTQYPDIAFAADDRLGIGIVLSLKGKQLQRLEPEELQDLPRLVLGEPYQVPVYNFTVEECHTYYVGEVGVWVHNTGCTPEFARELVGKKAERDSSPPECFPSGTLVICEGGSNRADIDDLQVGDMVLSRCERTGKQEYHRVTRRFSHYSPMDNPILKQLFDLTCITSSGEKSGVLVTAEHQFWVNGKGWVKAIDLKSGDNLEICDPLGHIDNIYRPHGYKGPELFFSGKRWQARVISVTKSVSVYAVHNIEVEDFHTYFVGCLGIWVHNKNII